MPLRETPLVTGEFYHIFNRGINKQPIFLNNREYQRAQQVLSFYSFASPRRKFSKFLLLPQEDRIKFWEDLKKENNKLVEITCFCLMPNHFHFLLKQQTNNGISRFMSNFQNSYTRYFNTKHEGIGPLLQGQFKAVRIEDENQLLHLSRYIHLNPYSSFTVKEIKDLMSYPWSSFPEYLGETEVGICIKDIILSNFRRIEDYKKFVFDQADYQRELKVVRHLLLEKT